MQIHGDIKMTDRELNLAICKEIEQVAVKTWERVKEKMEEGSYTANQVNDEQERFGNLDMEMATVEVGTFRCEFPICESFRLLHQFYRLCSVKDKERVRFTYMKKKEVLLDAEVTIEKQHKPLEKMVDNDNFREIMRMPYLDVKHKLIVSSDGHVLGAFRADIHVNKGDAEGASLPLKMVSKPGTYHVTAYADGSCQAVCGGVTYSGKLENVQRYPNYIGVLDDAMLIKERHYRLTKEGVSQLAKFIKSLSRIPGNGDYFGSKRSHRLRYYARRDEQVVHVQFKDEDYQNELTCELPLAEPCQSDLHIMLMAELTMRFISSWNGSFWYQGPTRSVMFDTDTGDTIIQMPLMDEHPMFVTKDNAIGTEKWSERYETKVKRKSEPTRTKREKPEQTFNFMTFYTIDQLASGTYEVRGEKRELLDRDIRLMGRYLMEHPDLFRKSQEYFNKTFGQGEVARKLFPLPMDKLYTAIKEALEHCGADVNAILQKKEAKPVPKPVPEPQPDPEPEPQPNDITITRTSEVVGSKFYPLLIVNTEGETFRVAGNSMYNAIASADGTITEENQRLFDSIDAFITDSLITKDNLNEEAIFNEMAEFFQMVDEATQLVN